MERMPNISHFKLELCCTQLIKQINSRLNSFYVLEQILIPVEIFRAFFYPPGYSNYASLASTYQSITTHNWVILAKAVQSISPIARKTVRDWASWHAMEHARENKRQLQLFWEGVFNAFE